LEIYLLIKRCVQTTQEEILLEQVAQVWCGDQVLRDTLQKLPVCKLQPDTRAVYSAFYFVAQVQSFLPEASVHLYGETEVILEWQQGTGDGRLGIIMKIILVSLVTFFGTAFTIMAYHNDIGITKLFREVYRLFTGRNPGGISPLEIGYSIGLAGGILLFYNHIGPRKLTNDPTPMEVSMQEYESAVNDTLVAVADRQGAEQEAVEK